MTAPFARTLDVAGTFNFRDVGEYDTHDGCRTRTGVFYRSGAIHDLEAVGAVGVRTVVDLRSASDVARDAGAMGELREHASIRRVVQPLVPGEVGGMGGFEYLNEQFGRGISAGRYRGYLEIGADNVRDVFRCFAAPDAFPTVVHCTAGKDRTGVITALVLDVVGVPHETIVEDYALSNESLPELLRVLSGGTGPRNAVSESDLARYGAPPEAMAGFLQAVYRDFGSGRDFLKSIGVDPQIFSVLEDCLLDTSPP